MANSQRPPQHNDSIDRETKRADERPADNEKAATGPHNPHTGKGNDERGSYGKGDAAPATNAPSA